MRGESTPDRDYCEGGGGGVTDGGGSVLRWADQCNGCVGAWCARGEHRGPSCCCCSRLVWAGMGLAIPQLPAIRRVCTRPLM